MIYSFRKGLALPGIIHNIITDIMETVYTVHEVSKMLKIHYRKILDEIALGRLLAFKVGLKYRVLESSLMEYFQDNKVEK